MSLKPKLKVVLKDIGKWGATPQIVKMISEVVVKKNTGGNQLPAVLQIAEHSRGKNLVEGQDHTLVTAPIHDPRTEDIDGGLAAVHQMRSEKSEADHGIEGNRTDHGGLDQEARTEVQDPDIASGPIVEAVNNQAADEVTVTADLEKEKDEKPETKDERRTGRKKNRGNQEVIKKGILAAST
ncbi:hypothetical protein chiPu_0014781 [Chiloscyllium punctatum]|uniref:Uncharacterized protein n=1 Tax=Chiloscyllium punctatum TaxID=137246 RepID=A0A401T0Y1_CHIPU|nr:hypothetical protein [Chiloscyllium punctatum]